MHCFHEEFAATAERQAYLRCLSPLILRKTPDLRDRAKEGRSDEDLMSQRFIRMWLRFFVFLAEVRILL